ncbi:hypothetical protein [Phycicoccus avicenniae]|uniref:hypothetical protein n=1 Tax=Phycicoccus avicenniae TaxID=2828860 RepID=UPI003D28946C
MTATATWTEVEHLDTAETLLVSGWAHFLTHGQTPEFIAGLIVAAVHYEPRLGMSMDVCEKHGCSTFVDEAARDELGRLFCSEGCRDEHDSNVYDEWVERTYLCGGPTRREPSYEIDPMTGRWAS